MGCDPVAVSRWGQCTQRRLLCPWLWTPSWPIRRLAYSLSRFFWPSPTVSFSLKVLMGCLSASMEGKGWSACLGALCGGAGCAGLRGLQGDVSGVMRPVWAGAFPPVPFLPGAPYSLPAPPQTMPVACPWPAVTTGPETLVAPSAQQS